MRGINDRVADLERLAREDAHEEADAGAILEARIDALARFPGVPVEADADADAAELSAVEWADELRAWLYDGEACDE